MFRTKMSKATHGKGNLLPLFGVLIFHNIFVNHLRNGRNVVTETEGTFFKSVGTDICTFSPSSSRKKVIPKSRIHLLKKNFIIIDTKFN